MKKTMLNRISILTLVLTVALMCQASLLALAHEPVHGTMILKVDRANIDQMPKDFRTSNDPFLSNPPKGKPPAVLPSREGMETLFVSGSSVFSELEFAKMLGKLPKDKVIIMDMREESHGWLNGISVSWYGPRNMANVNLTQAQVEKRERDLVKATIGKTVKVGKLNGDKSIGSIIEMNVTEAITEKELSEKYGVKYYRITCTDYVKPSDEKVDQFLKFYKKLPKDTWLHFHCHAGEGRTTAFMAMVDMIKNGQKVSYDDIMARQWLIGGQDLRLGNSPEEWKKVEYTERAKFTKDFYEYVKQNPDLKMSWTEWAQKNNMKRVLP